MYGPTELKKGTVIDIDGKPYQVIEYSQKVMGRGGSIVNVKVRNLIDGAVIPKTYKGQEKIAPAEVEMQSVQYLYNDGSSLHFMNPTTYDQFELASEFAEDQVPYLKDSMEVQLQFFNGRVINLILPKNLFLKVEYTEDAVKGDTTSNVMKDATLETGLVIKVPAFIKVGDEVSVDTETGLYRERKK